VLRLTIAARFGIHVVLLHDNRVIGLARRGRADYMLPQNYDTEEAAVAALRCSLTVG
jgi:hypothetical protein